MKDISIREKYAITMNVYSGGALSPSDMYRVAYAGTLEQVNSLADLPSTASRWWWSKRVQEEYTQQQAIYKSRVETEREKVRQEAITKMQARPEGTLPDGRIDYSIPANQLSKINEILNSSNDAGEALDALRLLISKQSEIAPESKNEDRPVRFFAPLRCNSCALYKKAKAGIK